MCQLGVKVCISRYGINITRSTSGSSDFCTDGRSLLPPIWSSLWIISLWMYIPLYSIWNQWMFHTVPFISKGCLQIPVPSQWYVPISTVLLRNDDSSFVVRCTSRIAHCANVVFGSPGRSINCSSRIPTYWCAFLNCKWFSQVRVTFYLFGRPWRWIYTPQKST